MACTAFVLHRSQLNENTNQANFLYSILTSKLAKIYFHFLDRTLENMQLFNLVFQSQQSTLHLHYTLASNLFEKLLILFKI